jgi:hypothetical protein
MERSGEEETLMLEAMGRTERKNERKTLRKP